MDRISSLPDDVITHILSFLPIKKAALTSVLAKRWRYLFAFSPNLHFSDLGRQCFIDFVDRVLSLSGHSPIKKFSLICNQGVEPAHIDRWLCDVLNRGVVVVDLDLGIDSYSLPFQIFTCNTLVELTLYALTINELPENAFLPALQTLALTNAEFYSLEACAFAKLLSACPVLQDLCIEGLNYQWKCCRAISSPSLKRLTIMRFTFGGIDVSDFVSVTFDLPNLTYFRYSDYIPGSYPVVNLGSLVEANLDLVVKVDENDNIISNATNLIKGLRNVEIMNLSRNSLEMFYFFREAIPVFVNLLHLSLQPLCGVSRRGLPFLLNNSPNLKTLIINGPLNVGQSGFVEITELIETSGDLEQLKHFLGKQSCLELLEVTIWGAGEEDKSLMTKDLLMFPRASSKCKIKVNYQGVFSE